MCVWEKEREREEKKKKNKKKKKKKKKEENKLTARKQDEVTAIYSKKEQVYAQLLGIYLLVSHSVHEKHTLQSISAMKTFLGRTH